MTYVLNAGKVVTSNGILHQQSIVVTGENIADIGHTSIAAAPVKDRKVISLDNYTVLPGLIDLHIHGANGFDTLDASYESLNEMSKYMARYGVTSFLATTVTARMPKILSAVENIADCYDQGLEGAKLLGAYVEGPYINSEYKGAHPESYIRELNIEEIDEIISKSRGTVKIFVLAPEKKHANHVIKHLAFLGIKVALGHSNATYTETVRAIENGASIAVHTFNGMRALHHREPGIIGAVLNNDNVMAELIGDGVHVDIPVIQILLRCKAKEDILLVTDCMMAGGLRDGKYDLGELPVYVKDNIARVEGGSLAGSTLRLIDGVKNLVHKVGVPLLDAVNMASLNPARAIDAGHLGSIKKGMKADIIAIDDDFNVVFTMISGKVVYDNISHN